MSSWLRDILESSTVAAVSQQLEDGAARVPVEGVQGSSTTLLAGAVAAKLRRPALLVVAHLDDADDAVEDLSLIEGIHAVRFGALEVLPGESAVSLELLAERLGVVERLVGAKPQTLADDNRARVIVAPVQALMQAVPEAGAMGEWTLSLETGRELPQARLIEWLASAGYSRVEAVEQPGEFAARGGIIDLFPPAGFLDDNQETDPGLTVGIGPLRLDYFGDEIESIRRIDPDTMGSGLKLDRVSIIGASTQKLQSDDRTTNLVSLLPPETIVVLSELLELSEQARGYFERLTNQRGIYPPNALFKLLTKRQHVEVNQYAAAAEKGQAVRVPVHPLPEFDKDAGKAVAEVGELAAEGGRVVVLCEKVGERSRLAELLREHAPAAADHVAVESGYLHRGFLWTDTEAKPQASLVVIPHHELFHRYMMRRRVRRIAPAPGSSSERATDAFIDLNVGDYVVHVDHGIARFIGLKSMTRNGQTEDYLTLEFDGKALLHVPAAQIDLVQKYVGGFRGNPPLSLLGGKRWAKQKAEAEDAAKELAAEMLRIQAARAALPGLRFPPDTAWQKEFEAEFPYEETQDQLAAIGEVKKDMADEQPMDRLICGDVGFGKTEIAIRAAFKAAEFGKQVAVLVPTTILAEQHERTFRDRFADYPFRIESISRFKTGAEQTKTLKALERGEIDVIIGTHRVLSEDVKFADLGLVIIDEEQRFGVEHKNKLMRFRLTVDVLTLSATPIPRTLHMAMLGLRDISSLTTAPMDRRAVVTEVVPYEKDRVKRAILRELNRDGQVYFVHNRVHNIQSVADDIQKLVPDARIVVGHGQMPGHELEDVMLKFVRRKADVLVCTTIIESGLDIPTANTIFINAADHFGLADLHQLRGRVGRYKHRAYCYLLLPEDRPVTDHAAQRLRALEQYSMLGSGFKIAMRDLEIRGAGNLLGAEQSGHIAAVGYEMYCHLLEEATHRLKNETAVRPVRTHLELPLPGLSAHVPKAWIGSEKFRMEAYRRLSRAATLAELDAVEKDLTDAYGPPPPPARTLIDLTEIRIAAGTLGIDSVKRDGPDVIIRTDVPRNLDGHLRDAPGSVRVIDDKTIYFRPPANYLEPATLLAVLRKLLVRPLREPGKAPR